MTSQDDTADRDGAEPVSREPAAPPAPRRRRSAAEKALIVLGDGAMFTAIGAALGVFGALLAGRAAPEVLIGLTWVAAALVALGGVVLRARVGWAASTVGQGLASAFSLGLDMEPARRPLAALGPALGFAVAAALLGSGVLASVLLSLSGLFGVIGLAGAAAAVAPSALRGALGGSDALGDAATRRLALALQALIWLVGGATALQWLGAPTAAIFAAIGAIAVLAAVAARDHLRALYSGWLLRSENKLRLGDTLDVLGDDGRPMLSGEIVALTGRSATLLRADGARVEAPAALLLERPFTTRRTRRDASTAVASASRATVKDEALGHEGTRADAGLAEERGQAARVDARNGVERASA